MLILTGNKAINFEQVFYFAVEKPMSEYRCIDSEKPYTLFAYRGNNGEDPDSVVIKNYLAKEEAYADLRKIAKGYISGAAYISID